MLRERIRILSSHVDYFVLVECNETFTQNKKPSYFDQAVAEGLDRENIVRVQLQKWTALGNEWNREAEQRNAIQKGLEYLQARPEDLVMISDVDEIPCLPLSSETKSLARKQACALNQDFYYYSFQWKKQQIWHGTVVTTVAALSQYSPQFFRDRRDSWPRCGYGWHLSFFGTCEDILTKLQNYSHQEHNNDRVVNNIQHAVKQGKDLFGRKGSDTLEKHTKIPNVFQSSPDPWFSAGIQPQHEQ